MNEVSPTIHPTKPPKPISIRRAAIEAGIPYSTARNHILGLKTGPVGRQPKFTPPQETSIANLLLNFEKCGIPLTKHLLDKVQLSIGKAKGLRDDCNTLSHKWYQGFVKRNPEIALRIARPNERKAKRWIEENSEQYNIVLKNLKDQGQFDDLWDKFNLEQSLKEDFLKPGRLPSTPKATPKFKIIAKPVAQLSITPPRNTYAPQKRKLREAFSEMGLPETDIDFLIKEVERRVRDPYSVQKRKIREAYSEMGLAKTDVDYLIKETDHRLRSISVASKNVPCQKKQAKDNFDLSGNFPSSSSSS